MRRVLLFATIIFVTLCMASGVYFYRLYQERRAYRIAGIPIQIIAQTGPEKEALKTDCLAELIGLSCDEGSGDMNEKKAQERLLASPVIKQAQVKRVTPGVLSIDYSLRKPYVFLADYENIALDREGYSFPFSPFYTPKNMPSVYLGLSNVQWKSPVEKYALAFEILSFLEKEMDLFKIELLDISQAEHASLGRREVTLIIREEKGRHYLRLTPLSYKEELSRYFQLKGFEGDQIIDLRLPKLAFIKGKKDD